MAEKIISPGVFTNEIDQSFLPAAVADIGAAIIGPTLKGPAGIPTIVTSFSDFQAKFGDVFKSGSNSFQYLTSHAAEEYLKNSNTLTVVRVMDGTFGPATAGVPAASLTTTSGVQASGSVRLTNVLPSGSAHELTINGVDFIPVESASLFDNSSTERYVTIDNTVDKLGQNLVNAINAAQSLTSVSASYNTSNNNLELTASATGTGTIAVTTGSVSGHSQFLLSHANDTAGFTAFNLGGGIASVSGNSFELETLADGTIMNNASATATTNNILVSGSKHNVRYEIAGVNNSKGTFNLLIRAGNDNIKRKQTLETFNNVSLDPNSTNFILKMIGDQKQNVRTEDGVKYLQLSGSYANKSRFVRVKSTKTTIDYIDENGNVRDGSLSGSLPALGSGSSNGGFTGGADGMSGFDALGNHLGDKTGASPANFYENISTNNSQGFDPTAAGEGKTGYEDALDLIANQDEFDVNLILLPGIISAEHTAVASKAIDVCESRGDCFVILDPVVYGSTLSAATTEAEGRDSNFGAVYWPWVKVPDSQVAGTQRWVPPSVVLGGVYAFNDRVAHPWFAPAGLNRGGITTAIQAERKLTQGNRDDLYDSNVNPIATFPGQGVTVFGQKTLQKKSSALDRINVRRLLIRVKKFIASSSRFLVFEQNTAATRRRFLGIVNPFLENVQSQSGLSAFRVVMDETNNTPDTIDRNQLVGQLFLQPTRTAEFIVLDFTIQPTGASFPE